MKKILSVLTKNKKSTKFLFPIIDGKQKQMAYVSSWDDAWGQNIVSFEHIITILKNQELNIPLTMFISTNYKKKTYSTI
jgi:hypothetical protein